jgi:hypothetical protein
LINRIESVRLEQAFGQTQRHGGVIRPLPGLQAEHPTADQIGYGFKASRLRKFHSSPECVTDRQADQAAKETFAFHPPAPFP